MSIEIHVLQKKFGSHAILNGITTTIDKGMYGLLGRNGAGKITLLKIIATLLKPSGGDVTVNGIAITDAKRIRRIIGYLPQNFSFYPNMTVYGNMKYMAALSGVPTSLQSTMLPLLLQRVNLWDKRKKQARTLSGGMVRRLGIAQALLHEPEILIADEPTSGLDPEERLRIYNLLEEYAEDRIVLLSTHIASDIEAACTRVGVLDSGKMIFDGPVNSLAALAAGKVYEVTCPKGSQEPVQDDVCILSSKSSGTTIRRRILTQNRPAGQEVTSCKPTVEDGYMALLSHTGKEMDGYGTFIDTGMQKSSH